MNASFAICDWEPKLTEPLLESWRTDAITALEPGPTFLLNNADAELESEVARLTYFGIRIYSCHASFGKKTDLSAADETVRLGAVAEHKLCLKKASIAKADCLVIHPSVGVPREKRERHLEQLKKSLEEIVDAARQTEIRLALENMLEDHLCDNIASLRKIVDGFDSPFLGVCLDTGHSHITSGDVASDFECVRDRVIAMHMHDNDGKRDQHIIPGGGTIDWHKLVPRILDADLQFPLSIEAEPPRGTTQGEFLHRVQHLFTT